MKKYIIALLVLAAICVTAYAEKADFTVFFTIHETLDYGNIAFADTGESGAVAKKDDGDQYFYLTPVTNNLPSGRKAYFRSMLSKEKTTSAIASKSVTVTKSTKSTVKAKYNSGKAKGGKMYFLACAGQAIAEDQFLGQQFKITGRWNP